MEHSRAELTAFVESSNLPIMAKAPVMIMLHSLTEEQIKPLLIPFGIVMDAIVAVKAGNETLAAEKCQELGTLLYQVVRAYAAPPQS